MSKHMLVEAYSICRERLKQKGVQISVVTDFSSINGILEILGKPYLTPSLSPFANDFSQGNCFWLIAMRRGEVIAAGGTHFDDLGDEPVSEFWRRSAARQYGRNHKEVVSVSRTVDQFIGGKLVYFGDLFVAQKGDRRRLSDFVLAGHMLAGIKWSPDFTYVWLREEDLRRGAGYIYGFMNTLPIGQVWHDPPSPRSNTEMCVYTERAKLVALAQRIIASQWVQSV
ncbi:MAG: hypothetical protein ABJL99_09815 [Aliishimia sp.]